MAVIRPMLVLASLAALLGLSAAQAAAAGNIASLKPEEVRSQHAAAARSFMQGMEAGLHLTGTVEENGSPGTFQAFFFGDKAYVRQEIGALDSVSYSGPEGHWSGSSYALPYKIDETDSPAETVLNLLSDGSYLDDPYWQDFEFVGEDAGGYNFVFHPAGLPAVKVSLYNDPSVPEFLQIMSAEVQLSPSDPESVSYRAFYHYQKDDKGELVTARETGKQIDHNGETLTFSDFTVDKVESLTAMPAEASVDFTRGPVGTASSQLAAPVEIPVDCSKGYFIVPLSFPGSTQTFNFILDTGASASLFTAEAWAAAGMKSDVNIPAHGHGSRVDFDLGLCAAAAVGRADAAPEARAPLAPFPVALIDDTNTAVLEAMKVYGASGILGVALLHQYVVSFDQLGAKLTLIPPKSFDPKTVPMPNVEFWLDVEDLIYLTGVISDGSNAPAKGDMVLDTGMQQQLSVLGETIAQLNLNFPKQGASSSTVLGGVRSFDNITVTDFAIGPLGWHNVPATVTSDDRGNLSARGLLGFVGVPLFFGNKITVDCFGQRMFIEAPSPEVLEQMRQLMEQQQQQQPETPPAVPAGAALGSAPVPDTPSNEAVPS